MPLRLHPIATPPPASRRPSPGWPVGTRHRVRGARRWPSRAEFEISCVRRHALAVEMGRNATNQKLDVAELLVRIFWSKPAPGGVRPSTLNPTVPGACVPTQAKSAPRSSRGARAAQTGVPRVSNSSGPHTQINQNVAHAGDSSPQLPGGHCVARIRAKSCHIGPVAGITVAPDFTNFFSGASLVRYAQWVG